MVMGFTVKDGDGVMNCNTVMHGNRVGMGC